MTDQQFDALLFELRRIGTALERKPRGGGDDDGLRARLLETLAEALGDDLELSFDAQEVIDAAKVNDPLSEALRALDVESAASVGALFRWMRDRSFGGLCLRRDGRDWTITRT